MRVRRLAAALVVAIVLAGASGAQASPYPPPDGKVFAGMTGGGTVASFASESGKHPAVVQTFISWGYTGDNELSHAKAARARAMVHITTQGDNGREAITPRGIATGGGDRFFLALNRKFAAYGRPVYVRLMAEMNGSWNYYSAYGPGFKGGAHSTRNFRQAWRRIVLIMRGGPLDTINAKLHGLGLPPVRGAGGTLPAPQVSFMWVPEVWGDPNVPGNSARAYWPGARYVDWVGTDFYSKFPNFRGLNAFYNQFRGKPFVFGEWAMWGRDDPGFVRSLFGWIRSHRRVRKVVYNQGSRPAQSPLALWRYPRSAAALRRELRSPLFAPVAPEFG